MSKTADVLIEAAERLELLGFDSNGRVVQKMLEDGATMYSDGTLLFQFSNGKACHAIYDLSNEQWEQVKRLQEKYNIWVYHVIRSICGDLGIMDAYLYISLPMIDEVCNRDRSDIECKCPFAYVYNVTDPELSEFGSIGVEFRFNALVRTA